MTARSRAQAHDRRSVLAQTYRNFELHIVDDASTDGTVDVARSFGDPRIHVVVNETNLGPRGNWNRALSLATGRYYKLLPQDDLLAPTCLQDQVAVLDADADERIALVFGWRRVIDHRDRPFVRRGLGRERAGPLSGPTLVRRCLRAGTNLIGEPGNGLIRRSLAARVGAYDTEHPYMVDLDYWFRVLAHGDAYYTATWSSSFRISQQSWSVALGRRQLDDFRGFVDKYAHDDRLGISDRLRSFSCLRARANTLGRALIYRAVLPGGDE